MSEVKQANFEGWGIVDVLGHQRYVGYITTEAFGQAVLFRIDVPALEERERVTKRPGHFRERGYLPAGTTVKEGAVPGYTKLIGAGSIYAITPCTKEAALEAVEESQPRPLMSVALPPDRALPATEASADDPYIGSEFDRSLNYDDNDALNNAEPDDDDRYDYGEDDLDDEGDDHRNDEPLPHE